MSLYYYCYIFLPGILAEKIERENYVLWALTPLLITFFLPMTIAIIMYLDALILQVYKMHWGNIVNAYENGFQNAAIKTVAAIWHAHARLWHGKQLRSCLKRNVILLESKIKLPEFRRNVCLLLLLLFNDAKGCRPFVL